MNNRNQIKNIVLLGAAIVCSLQTSFANTGRIAYVADGNSPDPDDLGGTSAALAMFRAAGLQNKLVHCSHSCDLVNDTGRITNAQELVRQGQMQDACDDTAASWGGFGHLTFWNCRTQQNQAVSNLAAAINASTAGDRLWIVLAGEPDIIYFALDQANFNKSQFVTIISHHPVNENSGDFHQLSDIENDFNVSVARIPDQNPGLSGPISGFHWARDHADPRIREVWRHVKIAEQDGIHPSQNGRWDISDAGMAYYWITGATNGGDQTPNVNDVRTLLTNYVANNPIGGGNNPPSSSFSSPTNGQSFAAGANVSVTVAASDSDGSIANVKLYLNGAFVRQENLPPYDWGANDSLLQNMSAGTYSLRAVATDNQGATDESTISITVGGGSPPSGGDVDFQFNNSPEGWERSPSIEAYAITAAGEYLVRAAPNSDPYIFKNGLSFSGSNTTEIRVRMKAQETGIVQLFWGTTQAGGFSGARVKTVSYSTANVFQEIVFNMSGEAAWIGKTITSLRVDTTSGSTDKHTWFDSITSNGSGGNPSGFVSLRRRSAIGFAMDGGAGGTNSQNVSMQTFNASDVDQQWEEISRGGGFYTYKKRNTNFVLDGGGGLAENNDNVYLWAEGPANQNQHWKKIDMGSGFYRLEKRNASTHSIDGGGGAGFNGQNVKLWDSGNGNWNQHWQIQ